MGCDEQNGLPVSMRNMQRQPVRQGLLTPQLPPQVAEPFASLRNCRAETVPAQRTPMNSAVKNIDLISFMIAFLLVPGPNGDRLFCRFGCNEAALAYGGSRVVEDAGAAQNVRATCFLGAEALAGGLERPEQLVSGNRSRAENAHDQCAEEHWFDLLVHGCSFLVQLPDRGLAGLAAMNPHTPVVALGLLKTHPQPRTLGQGCVLLQKWCWQVVS
jgi:hypothetical protein